METLSREDKEQQLAQAWTDECGLQDLMRTYFDNQIEYLEKMTAEELERTYAEYFEET